MLGRFVSFLEMQQSDKMATNVEKKPCLQPEQHLELRRKSFSTITFVIDQWRQHAKPESAYLLRKSKEPNRSQLVIHGVKKKEPVKGSEPNIGASITRTL